MLRQNGSDYTPRVDERPWIQDITYVGLSTDITPNLKMRRLRTFLVIFLRWLSAVMMVVLFILLWSTEHLQGSGDTDLG
jgi:hypothetical protein